MRRGSHTRAAHTGAGVWGCNSVHSFSQSVGGFGRVVVAVFRRVGLLAGGAAAPCPLHASSGLASMCPPLSCASRLPASPGGRGGMAGGLSCPSCAEGSAEGAAEGLDASRTKKAGMCTARGGGGGGGGGRWAVSPPPPAAPHPPPPHAPPPHAPPPLHSRCQNACCACDRATASAPRSPCAAAPPPAGCPAAPPPSPLPAGLPPPLRSSATAHPTSRSGMMTMSGGL